MNSINRRELLAAFLGAPAVLAASGCGSPPNPPPVGRLVEPSLDFGHRLRDTLASLSPDPPAKAEMITTKVVIVGSGVAGLAAARRLEKSGVDDFVVLELESKPGGKSRSDRSQVSAFPWGAHYVPSPRRSNAPLVELFDELGAFEGRDSAGEPIPHEHWLVRDPESRICFKGAWYEGLYLHAGASQDDRAQFAKFESLIDQWVAFRGEDDLPAFTIPSSLCSQDARVLELDRISMADWLVRNQLTSPRLLWYVDYACRDDYGMHSETTSAWAGIFYFAARRDQPGGKSQPFLTWPEGNGFLVDQMMAPLKSRTALGWAAARIVERANPAGATRVEVLAVDSEGDRRWYSAERVVFAAPRFLSPYLLPELPPKAIAASRAFEYSSWAVANLHLDGRPQGVGFPMCWDNVFYESPSLGYVAATHQRGIDHGPTVLTYYYPLCAEDAKAQRERLLETSREQWAEVALSDIETGHPNIRGLCTRLDVCRWGHAMVRPVPGFISGSDRTLARQPTGRVHFGHSDLSGIPLFEEAFDHGWRAAGEVLDALAAEDAA